MEPTTPTIRPAPERTTELFKWTVEELENEKGYHFITPEGYIFGFSSKEAVLIFVADISWNGKNHGTMYGDSHDVYDGTIHSWNSDPWINPGIEHGAEITKVSHFIDVAMTYAMRQWL